MLISLHKNYSGTRNYPYRQYDRSIPAILSVPLTIKRAKSSYSLFLGKYASDSCLGETIPNSVQDQPGVNKSELLGTVLGLGRVNTEGIQGKNSSSPYILYTLSETVFLITYLLQ